MKKDGFTVYELLISIVLLSIIIVSLTSIIFNARNSQAIASIEYEMKAYRGLIINEIEKDKNTTGIYDIDTCIAGTNCLSLDFDGTIKELSVDTNAGTVTYDGIVYSLPTNAYFSGTVGAATTTYTVSSGFDSILTISIPIKHYESDRDYSVKIVNQYDSDSITYTNTSF